LMFMSAAAVVDPHRAARKFARFPPIPENRKRQESPRLTSRYALKNTAAAHTNTARNSAEHASSFRRSRV
jgi:hypothetical protein